MLEYEGSGRMDDDTARGILQCQADVKNVMELQRFEKSKRNEVLRSAKAKGLSVWQIAKLTGLKRGRVLIA